MGDVRFERPYERVASAADRAAAIRALSDEDVIAALAAARAESDPYLANVLASEAQNRVRRSAVILRTAAEAVMAQDAQGRCTQMNPAAERLLGWTSEELSGLNVHEMIHFEHEDGTPFPSEECPIGRAAASGEELRAHETVLIRKDGRRVHVVQTAAPLVREGEVEGVVVTFTDITDRKRVEGYRATVAAVTAMLATARSLDDAGARAIALIGKGFGWDAGELWVLDEPTDELRFFALWHDAAVGVPHLEAVSRATRFGRGNGVPGRILVTGESAVIQDFTRLDASAYPRAAAAAQDGLRGMFAFPCLVEGQPVAVLGFFSRDAKVPEEALLERVETLSSRLGHFIKRRRDELALRDSEARKTSIVEASLDPIVTLDVGARIVDWNAAAARVFGWSGDEARGRDMVDLLVEEKDRAMARASLTDGDGARPFPPRQEVVALRKGGAPFPAEVSIAATHATGTVKWTAYFRDLTEQKAAQATSARLAAIVENAGVAIFSHTLEGVITSWNLGAQRLYGYAAEEVMGRHLAVLAPSGWNRELDDLLARLRRGERIQQIQTQRVTKLGDVIDVQLSISPLRDARGRLVGGSTIAQDVTALHVAQDEREAALRRERAARERAEDAERRARYLAEAGLLLASSLDFEATLRSIASLAVRDLSDWCAVFLLGPGAEARPFAVEHLDPRRRALAADVVRLYPQPPPGVLEVLASGEPLLIASVDDEVLRHAAQDGRHLAMLRELGASSAMVVPVVARGRTLGAITFARSGEAPRFDAEDVQMASAFANHAALAIENAKLYQDARDALRQKEDTARALEESEARYRSIWEETPDVLCRLDERGHVLSLNPAFEAFTGERAAAWRGKDFRRLVAPADLPAAEAVLERLLRGERPPPFELRLRTRDGPRPMEFVAVPCVDDGEVAGVYAVGRDVAWRRVGRAV